MVHSGECWTMNEHIEKVKEGMVKSGYVLTYMQYKLKVMIVTDIVHCNMIEDTFVQKGCCDPFLATYVQTLLDSERPY